MLCQSILLAFLNAGLLVEAGVLHPRQDTFRGGDGNGDEDTGNSGNGGGGALCLEAGALQTASASTGQDADNPTEGQANSATDDANFINFCSGKTLTNGLQVTEGSCNGVVMGEIPSTANMVSCSILFPQHDDTIPALEDFDIAIKVANLQAGAFTNPQETYYSAPQQLNGQGNIIGHVHITVQDLGDSLNPTQPLDPTRFAFFKGINDNGDGNGLLSASVPGGLPAGNYRVCTMSSASNHQPVLMPVAQRGSQEDCQKFVVSDDAGQGDGGGNAGDDDNNDDGGASGDEDADAGGADDGGNNNNNNNGDNDEEENGGGDGGNSDGGDDEEEDADSGRGGDDDDFRNQDDSVTGTEVAAAPAVTNGIFLNTTQTGAPTATETVDAEATEVEAVDATQTEGGAAATETGEAEETADAEDTEEGGVEPDEAVGGITPPPVEEDKEDKERPFKVGRNRFGDRGSAAHEACQEQNTKCCSAARSGFRGVSTRRCNNQIGRCISKLSRER
ncbi:uncharacterized protein MKZ38_004786 [Zalerion maritima]|uniref:Ribosomal protein s17 n=1 Tax=Zalerion maritima TaxID=339359 RepID=A0AAD5RRT5_9PEZI|nr:uncharacterized protein MKZ38_004786 [Zalerion maritima]